jgi:hypothetical protein
MKNTFTIYLALMRVYGVSDIVCHKLKEYIEQAIIKLNFVQEETALLQVYLS